jgi:putative endopeptidase
MNEKLLSNLKQDSHAPAIIRINGALSNMIGFYHTFNVTKGDVMFREPENQIVI